MAMASYPALISQIKGSGNSERYPPGWNGDHVDQAEFGPPSFQHEYSCPVRSAAQSWMRPSVSLPAVKTTNTVEGRRVWNGIQSVQAASGSVVTFHLVDMLPRPEPSNFQSCMRPSASEATAMESDRSMSDKTCQPDHDAFGSRLVFHIDRRPVRVPPTTRKS